VPGIEPLDLSLEAIEEGRGGVVVGALPHEVDDLSLAPT
jgi:hypothetical protein